MKAAPRTVNQDIVICGQRIPIGAPVVLWDEPPYYDATKTDPRFGPAGPKTPVGPRYQPGRVRKLPNPAFVAAPKAGAADTRAPDQRSETIDEVLVSGTARDPSVLREVVDQFVLHHDACGLSRTCFKVLQDVRGLSVHFMLDIDGTIYQTIDLRDTTWHATKSNRRSIGIEIANIGAYTARDAWQLEAWYQRDAHGTRITFPAHIVETGVRTPGFVGRPARAHRVLGEIQGDSLQQFDFTPEQYASLVKLTRALCREFPKIKPDAPRDEHGFVQTRALTDEAWREFGGILGHYHVQTNKNDPGPAFDWEPFLAAVRAQE
ncbi:MAG: N-acetylmuramoyl-L-alanine amidase [Planctomycetes bacterium]|nr:N-acetylmuramoyl-L-alanine amidase [Planctomycetota bacterium]